MDPGVVAVIVIAVVVPVIGAAYLGRAYIKMKFELLRENPMFFAHT